MDGQYSFSDNLRKIREKRGLSQAEVADGVGVSQRTVSAWELNERYPTTDRVYDLANFFKIPISALI